MIFMFLWPRKYMPYVIIWMFFLIPSCVFSYEELQRCIAPFSCGNQKDLFYPFWIPGREDCGHPDFQLECKESYAEVTISSMKFRILEANRTSRIIILARSDYNNNLCPQNSLNTLFNVNVLPFAPDTDMLTFYYDCSREISQSVSVYVRKLACEDDSKKSYYVTRSISSPLLRGASGILNDLRQTCRRNITIPAFRTALDALERNSTRYNLKKALQEGFKVGLNQDCLRCIDSGGACGYNQDLMKFICYWWKIPCLFCLLQ